jgi:GNAT superfamily N-acetyltransferase
MPTIKLTLSAEEFHQLPRNAAYRYGYLDGYAYLSPWPRHHHALLELRALPPAHGEFDLRPAGGDDLAELVPVFARAFETIQPYGSLDEATRLEASHQALERTRTGGDGPWIEAASFIARDQGHALGAILITLLPPGDPADGQSYRWREPPPADCIGQRLGRPHLTWVFVTPAMAGHGLGTSLLATAGTVLLELGYSQLLTTFMLGNDSSMLWHWRNGFRLLPRAGSTRRRARAES